MILSRLLGGRAAPDDDRPPPRPARRTYAIGDLHGRFDLFEAAMGIVAEDAGDTPYELVFLGDYVDRGPDSAALLTALRHVQASDNVQCLMGNHDRLLLDFLDDPTVGPRWMRLGGAETLASFGLPTGRIGEDPSSVERLRRLAGALADALGDELRGWLEARPYWWQSGDLIAVHALTDPTRSMEMQNEETLLWARPSAGMAARHDGTWVVHGHTIFKTPRIANAHIGIDTGAVHTGRLTIAVFTPEGEPPRFLTAEPTGPA